MSAEKKWKLIAAALGGLLILSLMRGCSSVDLGIDDDLICGTKDVLIGLSLLAMMALVFVIVSRRVRLTDRTAAMALLASVFAGMLLALPVVAILDLMFSNQCGYDLNSIYRLP